jgi:hypothetical protein
MSTRVTIVAIVAAVWFLLVVLELVRRRRLGERYALLWLFTCVVVLFFAAWPAALERFASAVGVAYAPTALFILAGAFVLLVLLHYATVVSSLTDRNTRLAQRVAILEERLAQVEQHQEGPREPGGLPVPDHPPGVPKDVPRPAAEPVER